MTPQTTRTDADTTDADTTDGTPAAGTPSAATTSRRVGIATVANLMPLFASLVTAPILARALGVDGRGMLAAATAPLLLATAALTLGMPEAVTYFVAKRIRRGRTLLIGVVAVSIIGPIGSVAIWFASPALAPGHPSVQHLIGIVGLFLTPSLLALIFRGYARAVQAWSLIAVEQAVSSAVRVLALLALLFSDALTVQTAAIITAVGTFIGAVVYLVFLRHTWDDATPAGEIMGARAHASAMSRFSLGTWVGSAAGIVLARLDQVLFLPLSDARQLGIYAVAVSLADMVRTFNNAVRDVVFSTQSGHVDDASLYLASRVSTVVTIGVGCAAVVVSLVAVPLVFGSAFAASTSVLAVILVGTMIGNPGSIAAAGISARGKPILRSLAIATSVVLNIVLVFALVPRMGAMGAAIASSVANGLCGLFVVYLAHRVFGLAPSGFLRLRVSDAALVVEQLRAVLRRFTPRPGKEQRS